MIESNSSSDPITLAPHLRPTEVESPKVTKKKKDEDELTVAGGGLGIRSVSWNPSGSLLAVGGYDDKVSQEQRASTSSLGDWHFLNIPPSYQVRILENNEWTEAATLDLSKRTIPPYAPSNEEASFGELVSLSQRHCLVSNTN